MEEEERSGYQRGCGARIFFFFNTKTSFLKGLSGIGRGEGEAGAGGGGSLRRQVVVEQRLWGCIWPEGTKTLPRAQRGQTQRDVLRSRGLPSNQLLVKGENFSGRWAGNLEA